MEHEALLLGRYAEVPADSDFYSLGMEMADLEDAFCALRPKAVAPKPVKKSGRSKAKSEPVLKVSKKEKDLVDEELHEMIKSEILGKDGGLQWDAIAGLDTVKELLKEAVVLPLVLPDFFKGIRRPWKGVCLYGPPGTGKTMLAKALASEMGTTFFNISASSLASKWKGDSEKLVRILFESARHRAPSVIFIDEIDSLCSSRGGAGEHESSRRMKTEILVQMDGLSTAADKFVVVIGATNYPWDLDEALRRRLEKRVYVPLPDRATIEQLLAHALREVEVAEDVHLPTLASKLTGYSGADITNICRDASLMALRKQIKGRAIEHIHQLKLKDISPPLSSADFHLAMQKIRPSVGPDDVSRYEQWHRLYGSV